jgi:CDGSH-type Zn-finger protein/uncharacterized Fe-S cluster protein YjdI
MAKIQEYRVGAMTVRYDPQRCIHAGECVRGLPAVFDTQQKPWIRLEQAAPMHVAEVVARCPSGALTADLGDGRCYEPTPAIAEVTVCADGPLYLRGQIELVGAEGQTIAHETRVALCRCGASGNKPYCDGSHESIGFFDTAQVTCAPVALPAEAPAGGALRVHVRHHGPLMTEGPVTVQGADGAAVYAGDKCFFCRCGGSGNKPFCDGTHKKIGFTG